MADLRPCDQVWNRAALENGGAGPLEGDRALAATILTHGLIMNGGVLHAIDGLEADEFENGCRGYEFFGLEGVAEQLRAAARLAAETAPMDTLEAQLDRAYWQAVPDDAALAAAFETHFELHPEAYAPMTRYPEVLDPGRVGSYPATAKAGGGYVWDEVLEYRVWCHPADGGDDYYQAFASYPEAAAFAARTSRAESPLALVLQREYIDEPSPGDYRHVRAERVTEWPVEFLRRPRRTAHTIPDFLAPDAPPNRLDILRGTVPS